MRKIEQHTKGESEIGDAIAQAGTTSGRLPRSIACGKRWQPKEQLVALTLKPPKPLTDHELLEFSRRNPGLQFERSVTGELIVTPTGSDAGR